MTLSDPAGIVKGAADSIMSLNPSRIGARPVRAAGEHGNRINLDYGILQTEIAK